MGFEFQSRYIALRIRAEGILLSFVMQCGGFFIYPKVKGNKIQNGGGKDIGFPFRRVKAGIKKAVTQKNALRSCPQR